MISTAALKPGSIGIGVNKQQAYLNMMQEKGFILSLIHILSVIGLHDMMYWFYAVKNQTYADFEPLLIVFLVYYIMNKVLSLIGKAIERKLKYD